MLTSVFRIRYNYDDFVCITTSESNIRHLVEIDAFKGEKLASQWKPLHVWPQDEYEDDRPRVLGDFARFAAGCLVMSKRAADGLSRFLAERGEFLKLVSDSPLVAWNCTRVINALDPDRTRGVKYPGGTRYIRISKYAMRENAIIGEHAFKVPERPGTDIFVSAAFVEAVSELNLTGLRLEPVEVPR